MVGIALIGIGWIFNIARSPLGPDVQQCRSQICIEEVSMINLPGGDNICGTDFVLSLSISNKGDVPDKITSINIPDSYRASVEVSGENSTIVSADMNRVTSFYCIQGLFERGDEVAFTVGLESGLILPAAVKVE